MREAGDFSERAGAALVTGATGAVGSEIARRLAAGGSRLVLCFRDREGVAEALAAELDQGTEVILRRVDLTDPEDAVACVEGALDRFDAIHSVIHAAGPFVPQVHVSRLSPARYAHQLEAESASFFNLASAALPSLRISAGSIVAVTSVAVRRFPARDVLSSSPKAAVEALVRALGAEEGRFGVRANCVAPGILDAGMLHRYLESGDLGRETLEAVEAGIPMRRLGGAAEVAEVACFLASDRASYVTGQVVDVDGGYSL